MSRAYLTQSRKGGGLFVNEIKETSLNRELWDNLVKVHVQSPFYNVPRFLKGKSSLDEIALGLLNDVRGKSILHLQCHFGLDSLSLARMGALVTGVDFSEEAIKTARQLNQRLQLDAKFIQSDVNRLDEVLKGKFDIVFASFGVLGWHADLAKWAGIISHFLKKKGKFCFAEFHPVLWMLSDDHSKVAHFYFKSDPIIEQKKGSYADNSEAIHGTSHCWNHSLGELFEALEGSSLTIRKFKEYDFSPYRSFPDAICKNGRYYIKGFQQMLPLAYSLTAIK